MSSPRRMRSVESRTKSLVKFINKTDNNIELFWLNFLGEEISYGTLNSAPSPLSIMDINTFVTHPWIAVDSENRQRLWLNSEEVFHPPQPRLARVVVGPNREQIRAKRANIFITKPVFNADKLMELCCRFVSKSVKLEDISSLPIPNFIKTEIERHYNSP